MMTSVATIPLFPLKTVLFPYGRMCLQIFEPRYIELISHCLKTDTGFGVVWLTEGNEVLTSRQQGPDTLLDDQFTEIGTYARIVDWDALENGLLGITIEGEKKFRVLSSVKKQNQQYYANIEWGEKESVLALPEEALELEGLLKQLLDHPHVARLNVNKQIEDVEHLACMLTQFLPIDESVKYQLLAKTDPLLRLQSLMQLLDNLSR